MAPIAEKSQLKRAPPTIGENDQESKKPRRSERIKANGHDESAHTPIKNNAAAHLPSPLTHKESTATETHSKATTVTPEPQIHHKLPSPSSSNNPFAPHIASPPQDTQPFSQFVYPPTAHNYGIENEEAEGVWGYLVPVTPNAGDALVLRQRKACPVPTPSARRTSGKERVSKREYRKQEEDYEQRKVTEGYTAGGYLIGRHPECDRIIESPTVSNRHCLFFCENKGGDAVAVLEDISGNGTFVNDALVGRNKRRELEEGDEISVLDVARFIFHYPRHRTRNGFSQIYSIQEQLGKGHFASVYLCIEKSTGTRYAVKKFEKRPGPSERSRTEGLQQEIAVLMGVSHPSLLCLKDTFDEADGVYLVLELAPEGELFNWIVMKHKLTEAETRKVFVQLFQGVKYLHERNIVHRDIKPENILLVDKHMTVKLADFGLAKIIGEESFTTTLCGTPSYVAPEILEGTSHRRYTRAVDVWSLGVVLYICLCGFPPFSDELYSQENPYTLSQQIKMGRFDYPSPYWDSVGDPALDLIDRMLTVDANERITIDECLEHPWTTNRDINEINPNDSTDGLTGAMNQLDFSRRKVQRERTLLSSLNEVQVTKVIPVNQDEDPVSVKVFKKNPGAASQAQHHNGKHHSSQEPVKATQRNGEADPAAGRQPTEFMAMGGKGDQTLFGYDGASKYVPDEVEERLPS